MIDRPFHTVKQIAEILDVRTHAVTSLIRSGQLVAVDISLKPGGRPRWRIEADAFDAFLAKRTYVPRNRRKVRRGSSLPKPVESHF